MGLEAFSYYLADCPDIIVEQLERNTVRAIAWIEHLPESSGIEAGMLGDDMAFKSGPLLRPAWMRKHYFPRLARVIAAHHARGIKVLFHSDGNLNPILGDLVDAGIDGLNPIEVLAGMDVADIHRRYPHLFLCGGIDVSQLLPLGTPQHGARGSPPRHRGRGGADHDRQQHGAEQRGAAGELSGAARDGAGDQVLRCLEHEGAKQTKRTKHEKDPSPRVAFADFVLRDFRGASSLRAPERATQEDNT